MALPHFLATIVLVSVVKASIGYIATAKNRTTVIRIIDKLSVFTVNSDLDADQKIKIIAFFTALKSKLPDDDDLQKRKQDIIDSLESLQKKLSGSKGLSSAFAKFFTDDTKEDK